jgi:hypothetical protein
MRSKALLGIAAVGMILCGCDFNEYRIELTPRGDRIERKLTVRRVGGGKDGKSENKEFPAEEFAALAKAYPKQVATDDPNVHAFAGSFGQKMPKGIGGDGSYIRMQTRMGSTSAYVERFRGDDDLFGQIDKQRKAIDETVDLLIGWFRSELPDDAGRKKLLAFMDTSLRKDLKNLVVYAWATRVAAIYKKSGTADAEFVARVAQYLMERKYFAPKDIPTIVRAFTEEFEKDSATRLPALLQRLIADRMGVKPADPVPDSLAFLASAEKAQASLGAYLKGTKTYRGKLAEWKKQHAEALRRDEADPDDGPPDPIALCFPEMGADIIPLDIGGTTDTLEVSLAAPVKPFETNGTWHAKASRITWKDSLHKGNTLPTFCYALWAEPDGAFQEKHFGKVVLNGQYLAFYCAWREGLTKTEAGQWDAFLDSLTGGKNVAAKLESFRFSTGAQAKPVVEQILEALEPEAPPEE